MSYKCNTKVRTSTDFIVIHCSATPPDAAKVNAAEIDRWHRKAGWQCLGYHYVITRGGLVEEGREADKIGSHVKNFNHNSLGICLVGGVNSKNVAENNFTDEQFDALAALLKNLKVKYPAAIIQGHRDFPAVAKACPSFQVSDWLKSKNI